MGLRWAAIVGYRRSDPAGLVSCWREHPRSAAVQEEQLLAKSVRITFRLSQ